MRSLLAGRLAWRTWLLRTLFELGVRIRAKAAHATIELAVAPDVRLTAPIADSRHFHTDEATFFYDNIESAPVDIGRNVWLANKCSVLMGVTIGDYATVAGHSVVTRDVAPRSLVAGAPARPIGATLPAAEE